MSKEHAPERSKPRGASSKRLLRLKDILALTGYSDATIYRLIKQGKFPRPVHLYGGYISHWLAEEVDPVIAAIVDDAVKARDAGRAPRRTHKATLARKAKHAAAREKAEASRCP